MIRIWGWLREQRYPLDSTLRERTVDLKQRYKTHRVERKLWRQARSLGDLGEVTARWLKGEFLYHPNGYDEGPAPETAEIIEPLVALNRAGFVTDSSQPGIGPEVGFDGEIWWQRAGVGGFAEPDIADQLETACADTGLIFIRFEGAGRRCDYSQAQPVTAPDAFVQGRCDYYHTHFGVRLSRSEVKLGFDGVLIDVLCNADQVTVIDPEWGRKDFLWSVLTGADRLHDGDRS